MNWWDAADGVYAKGEVPEAGSVLNFRATRGMRLGHVAVVKDVINSREIEIDHANWRGPGLRGGRISRNISVIDVSANNDWSAVRVALGHSDSYGSIYPTYGFIYDRPAGTAEAANTVIPAAKVPALNPPPHDFRLASYKQKTSSPSYEQVAEAPLTRHHGIDLSVGGLNTLLDSDAPNRSLR